MPTEIFDLVNPVWNDLIHFYGRNPLNPPEYSYTFTITIASSSATFAIWTRRADGTTLYSNAAGYAIVPVGDFADDSGRLNYNGSPLPWFAYRDGYGNDVTPQWKFIERVSITIPDTLCGHPFTLFVTGRSDCTWVYKRDILSGGGVDSYQVNTKAGYQIATLTRDSHICGGGGGGGEDCHDTPCGECCEQDRLLRVARCWGADGNSYSVSQGTFARNAPGGGSSYPCGCSSATPSQPLPTGDFFATDIHDRATGKLAGTQSVSLYALGGLIQGTSLESAGGLKTVRLFRARDYGREFSVMDIPGTYDFVQSVPHLGRLLLFGFRKKATGATAGTKQLYLRVGKQQADGTYSWSGEKAVALPAGAPDPRCGDFTLSVRADHTVELLYLSADPPCGSRLFRSRRIELDATNEWV